MKKTLDFWKLVSNYKTFINILYVPVTIIYSPLNKSNYVIYITGFLSLSVLSLHWFVRTSDMCSSSSNFIPNYLKISYLYLIVLRVNLKSIVKISSKTPKYGKYPPIFLKVSKVIELVKDSSKKHLALTYIQYLAFNT